ncbi:hypothetical protein ACJIZ3_020167 [Penstemon smallii]|uniref:MATH domain-containing protein n=1 Tax=Penstemon smallii TaxID=265156 RepID=A0ABD3SI16_9LAMI
MHTALTPLKKALVAEDLLKHSYVDVKVGVASCISEIIRITAPDAPYDDGKMKDVFQLIVSSFENMSDTSSRSYGKRATILVIVAKARLYNIMLDLECDKMIVELFQHFLKGIRDHHAELIFASMETLRPYLIEALKTSVDDYSEVVAFVCRENAGTGVLSKENISKDEADKALTEEGASKNDGGSSSDSLDQTQKLVDASNKPAKNGPPSKKETWKKSGRVNKDKIISIEEVALKNDTRSQGQTEKVQVYSLNKADGVSLSRKEDMKKSGRVKPKPAKDVLKSSAREDDDKEIGTEQEKVTSPKVTVETREASPSHFLFKIKSFSLLSQNGIDKYESTEFSAGDYKWKLIFYPNGEESENEDDDYIAVNLALADTSSLHSRWEVNAIFSIFLYNQKSDNFLAMRGPTRRFHEVKTEWGFPKFISKKSLIDPSNGYLVNDNCVFGAEFSELEVEWVSEEFLAGDHKWY